MGRNKNIRDKIGIVCDTDLRVNFTIVLIIQTLYFH